MKFGAVKVKISTTGWSLVTYKQHHYCHVIFIFETQFLLKLMASTCIRNNSLKISHTLIPTKADPVFW